MAYAEYDVTSPFSIIFRVAGTVWPLVLPYCILNCLLLIGCQFALLHWGIRISILAQGHALMSLLIAYLGVSKVSLAYERYMSCRTEMGRALSNAREIHQYAITLSENDVSDEAEKWRKETKTLIEQLIHGTVTMVKNSRHAQQLATGVDKDQRGDPFEVVHYLRCHLFEGSKALPVVKDLSPLERCKLLDLVHEFTTHFRELVRLASTPIPFALVQMGRTFVFIWVLSLPLVLTGKDFDDLKSVMVFVVLLTYGFLGLEMVAMKMSNPFGDEAQNDLDVKGMAKATIIGMENDATYMKRVMAEARLAQIQRQQALEQTQQEKKGRTTTISQRILQAPSENLDDSIDEMADDEPKSPVSPNKLNLPNLGHFAENITSQAAAAAAQTTNMATSTAKNFASSTTNMATSTANAFVSTTAAVATSTQAAVTPFFAIGSPKVEAKEENSSDNEDEETGSRKSDSESKDGFAVPSSSGEKKLVSFDRSLERNIDFNRSPSKSSVLASSNSKSSPLTSSNSKNTPLLPNSNKGSPLAKPFIQKKTKKRWKFSSGKDHEVEDEEGDIV